MNDRLILVLFAICILLIACFNSYTDYQQTKAIQALTDTVKIDEEICSIRHELVKLDIDDMVGAFRYAVNKGAMNGE